MCACAPSSCALVDHCAAAVADVSLHGRRGPVHRCLRVVHLSSVRVSVHLGDMCVSCVCVLVCLRAMHCCLCASVMRSALPSPTVLWPDLPRVCVCVCVCTQGDEDDIGPYMVSPLSVALTVRPEPRTKAAQVHTHTHTHNTRIHTYALLSTLLEFLFCA